MSGQSGISGISGISGQSGISGISGISGRSGVSGISGTDGTSGRSGISGISGISGQSGISGISGQSGQSGISGVSGISGRSGISGVSGISGQAVAVAGTTDYLVKFTSSSTIGNTTVPVVEVTSGSSGTTLVIGSSGATDTSGSIFEVYGTRGILLPRLTEVQRLALSVTAAGTVVYQTDADEGYYIYKSFGWVQII